MKKTQVALAVVALTLVFGRSLAAFEGTAERHDTGGPTARAISGEPSAPSYACPPCGCPGDSLRSAAEGTCPHCGMPLILVGSEKNVAIVVCDGVEPLDFAGPLEVFAADLGHFNVFTLSRDGTPITTGVGGLTVVPKYSFDSAPRASILVVPGGGTGALTRDERSMAFIRRAAAEAEIVMSVCSGAFVLGSAGLLDGLKATAHDADVEELEAAFPKVAAIRGARYVDNGKIITAGGVSAGIDAALHVIARLHGDDRAERVSAYLQHSRRAE